MMIGDRTGCRRESMWLYNAHVQLQAGKLTLLNQTAWRAWRLQRTLAGADAFERAGHAAVNRLPRAPIEAFIAPERAQDAGGDHRVGAIH
jgi:hypothetical protein